MCFVFLFVYLNPLHSLFFFFFNDTATTEIYTLSLHDALPISPLGSFDPRSGGPPAPVRALRAAGVYRGGRGDAIIRRRERVCAAAADARPGPRPPLAARRDRGSRGRGAAPLELLAVRRASHRLGVPDGSGRDLAPRRPGGRPHALAHVLLVGPPLVHHRDGAGGRNGDGLTIRAGLAAVGPRDRPARRGPRAVARPRGGLPTDLPRWQRQRSPRPGRGGGGPRS